MGFAKRFSQRIEMLRDIVAKQVVLLRVGVDAASGGIQGPLFKDGTFELICIPDGRTGGTHTYGKTKGRYGQPLVTYFPEPRRDRMAGACIHLDPEFETYTYGDPTSPKRSLRRLKPGDFLVFYCGLQEWDSENCCYSVRCPALYLAGYFVVTLAGIAADFDPNTIQREFGKNIHVRFWSGFRHEKKHLVLVNGDPAKSRLFNKAYRISGVGRDCAARPLKVLSREMRKVFGTFGGYNSIQRSPPRWVAPSFVRNAIRFLKDLE